MTQFDRSLGGIEHDGVQVGELEVIRRRPVPNLIGCGNSTDPPVPRVSFIEVRLKGVGVVGQIKACVVPRRVGEAVDRGEIVLRVQLNDVAGQGHRAAEVPDQLGL